MMCPSCNAPVTRSEAFCGACGAQQRHDGAMETPSTSTRKDSATAELGGGEFANPEFLGRAIPSLICIMLLVLISTSDQPSAALLWVSPLFLGAIIAGARHQPLTATIDGWDEYFEKRKQKAAAKRSKWSRYFVRPLFATATMIWRASDRVRDVHARSGVRAAAALYLAGFGLFAVMVVGYIMLAIVLIIVAVLITGWILSLLGNDTGSRIGTGVATRAVRRSSLFSGDRTVYYDESGNKIGESRETTGVFGDERTDHFDESGDRIGRSRHETGWFGDKKVVHYDIAENKTGTSREEQGIFDDRKTVHYDDSGEKTGFSREEAGFLGNKKIVHYDSAGNKIGETQQE